MTVLLVCADLHGSDEALDLLRKAESDLSPDAVIVCGDVTTYGSVEYMNRLLDNFDSDLMAVPGNCDTDEMLRMLEQAGASVHNRCVRKLGLDIFGFGGGLTSAAHMPFEVEEEDMVAGLKGVAVRGGVMVIHTPPRGMNDIDRSGRHLGSKGVLGVVEEFRPRLVLSGHIHESRGECTQDGTVFVNPGPARGGRYALVKLGQKVEVKLF